MKTLNKLFLIGFLLVTLNAFAAPDTEAPTAPANLKGFVYDPDFIYINWNKATDNEGIYVYRVYRNGELVATTFDTYFLDMEYDRDEFNYYGVTAVDKAGNESDYSNIIKDPRAVN